jgi:hypothetical protein
MHECVYLELRLIECVRRGLHHVAVDDFSYAGVEAHLQHTHAALGQHEHTVRGTLNTKHML